MSSWWSLSDTVVSLRVFTLYSSRCGRQASCSSHMSFWSILNKSIIMAWVMIGGWFDVLLDQMPDWGNDNLLSLYILHSHNLLHRPVLVKLVLIHTLLWCTSVIYHLPATVTLLSDSHTYWSHYRVVCNNPVAIVNFELILLCQFKACLNNFNTIHSTQYCC